MTDIELFEIDAEYWAGLMTALELSQLLEPYIPRMAYIETMFGINYGADGCWIDYIAFSAEKRSTRCFFSLMIAEELRYEADMIAYEH